MYKTPDVFRTQIVVDAGHGLYIFDDESAIGKTRLYHELKDLQAAGEPVCAIRYDDGVPIQELRRWTQEHEMKVVMVDRYDMYQSQELDNLLKSLYRKMSVLLDCKRGTAISCKDETVFMTMELNRIEVRAY